MNLFSGGKARFLVHSNTNKNKPQKQTTKTTKEGLRVRWGGPKGHLTWPLNPSKYNKSKSKRTNKTQQLKQNKQKQTKNKTKQIRRI